MADTVSWGNLPGTAYPARYRDPSLRSGLPGPDGAGPLIQTK
jgi:hypothetical protein